MADTRREDEMRRLAERCRDAWAVLRIVPAREGEEALRRHGRVYDEERFIGTRDGLADDMRAAAEALDEIGRVAPDKTTMERWRDRWASAVKGMYREAGRGEELRRERDERQAAIDRAYGVMTASEYVGGPSAREAWQVAMTALGPFVTQHQGQVREQ